MSAAPQIEKMPLAKSRSLKSLSKTAPDKVLCAHKGEKQAECGQNGYAEILEKGI